MCDNCGWEILLESIDEMLEEEKYEYALDTLEGIKETVTQNEHCTEGQGEAVENIRENIIDWEE